MSCPRCYQTSCPEAVSEITVNNSTVTAASSLAITVADLSPADPTKKRISIQVADEGYWLLRIWLTESATPSDQETLTPPTAPGASSFFKVTDSLGLIEFDIENASADSWYVHAALCGAVVVSDVVVAGV